MSFMVLLLDREGTVQVLTTAQVLSIAPHGLIRG